MGAAVSVVCMACLQWSQLLTWKPEVGSLAVLLDIYVSVFRFYGLAIFAVSTEVCMKFWFSMSGLLLSTVQFEIRYAEVGATLLISQAEI